MLILNYNLLCSGIVKITIRCILYIRLFIFLKNMTKRSIINTGKVSVKMEGSL